MGLSSYLERFLRKLFAAFKRPSFEAIDLTQYSSLCRFIYQSNQFSSKGVKPGAFLPKPTKTQISMCFVDSLLPAEIWVLGDVVGEGRRKPAKARAEMHKNAIGLVTQCKLRIDPDPKPHPRHVNIAGWPTEKDAQKAVALELCASSILYVR